MPSDDYFSGAGPERRYYDYLKEGKFMIQRSASSGRYNFYPRALEPGTGAADLEWVEASGDGVVYCSGGMLGGSSFALPIAGASAGEPPAFLWTGRSYDSIISPLVHEGHVYAISGDNEHAAELKCLEFDTGDVRWSNRFGASHRGNLLLVGGKLLILTEIGELILADPSPDRYRELHRMQAMPKTCWAPPAFADGLLYLRTNKGDLRCYDLRP